MAKTRKVRIREGLHDELKIMMPRKTDAERMDFLFDTSTLQITRIVENVLAKKKQKR